MKYRSFNGLAFVRNFVFPPVWARPFIPEIAGVVIHTTDEVKP
jgi:hypothetical protein